MQISYEDYMVLDTQNQRFNQTQNSYMDLPNTPSSATSSSYGFESSLSSSSNIYSQGGFSPLPSPTTPASAEDRPYMCWPSVDNRFDNYAIRQQAPNHSVFDQTLPSSSTSSHSLSVQPSQTYDLSQFQLPTTMYGPQDTATIAPNFIMWDQSQETLGHSPDNTGLSAHDLDSPFITPTKLSTIPDSSRLGYDQAYCQVPHLEEYQDKYGEAKPRYESFGLSTPSPTSQSFSSTNSLKFEDSPVLANRSRNSARAEAVKEKRKSNRAKKNRSRFEHNTHMDVRYGPVSKLGNKGATFRCLHENCIVTTCDEHPKTCPEGNCTNKSKKPVMEDVGGKECVKSRKCFKRHEHLKRHEISHKDEKNSPCPIPSCKKHAKKEALNRGDNLTSHIRTHLKENGRNRFCPLLVQKYAPRFKMDPKDIKRELALNGGVMPDDKEPEELSCVDIDESPERRPCDKCLKTLNDMKIDWQSRAHPKRLH